MAVVLVLSITLHHIDWGNWKYCILKNFLTAVYTCYICRQQSEDGERNGSDDDDEEKPGKRVIGPRKKFEWDEKLRSVPWLMESFFIYLFIFLSPVLWGISLIHNLYHDDGIFTAFFSPFRSLLCNLVRVKLGCYELEGKNSQSVEDYLKAFMETEVKPLWPKGWMQARSVSIK